MVAVTPPQDGGNSGLSPSTHWSRSSTNQRALYQRGKASRVPVNFGQVPKTILREHSSASVCLLMARLTQRALDQALQLLMIRRFVSY